jgi:hypothetical protein
MGASAEFSNATASELFPTERHGTAIGGLGPRNDKDAPNGEAGRNHFVRKLFTVGLIAALALAGAFLVARIVTPTSPVITCASPPIFALRPATRTCIRAPSVKLRDES